MQWQIIVLWAITIAVGIFDIAGMIGIFVVLVPHGHRLMNHRSVRWVPERIGNILEIPFGAALAQFRDHIWNRYTGAVYPAKGNATVGDLDRGQAYMERIVDRQINKARGVLPFNSILLTLNSLNIADLSSYQDQPIFAILKWTEYTTLLGLSISSILLLELFWVHWGPVGHYGTPASEMDATAKIVRDRSVVLDGALVLSISCVFAVVLVALFAPPSFIKH
jgi:hypothetical protein